MNREGLLVAADSCALAGESLLKLAVLLRSAAAQLSTPQPADAPVPESAAESQADGGGADALPSGWETVNSLLRIYRYAMEINRHHPIVTLDGAWSWIDAQASRGTAPTMLTAMCAALGLGEPHELQFPTADRRWALRVLDEPDVHARATKDEACRAALERYHARQQAPERAEGCMCPTEGVIHPRCPRCAQEFSSRLELEAKDGRAVL